MGKAGLVGNELQLEIVGELGDLSANVLEQSKDVIESLITSTDRSPMAKPGFWTNSARGICEYINLEGLVLAMHFCTDTSFQTRLGFELFKTIQAMLRRVIKPVAKICIWWLARNKPAINPLRMHPNRMQTSSVRVVRAIAEKMTDSQRSETLSGDADAAAMPATTA